MGMIPKNFIIILIERLHWYELKLDAKGKYATHNDAQDVKSAVRFS